MPVAIVTGASRGLGFAVAAALPSSCRRLPAWAPPEVRGLARDEVRLMVNEPQASHLQLLHAVAGAPLLERSSRGPRAPGYRWHGFGDGHLILP